MAQKGITFLIGIALIGQPTFSCLNFCVSDLPGEDQDLRRALEGHGIDALVLAPENGTGDLALTLKTRVKEKRTESADRKVSPV